MKTYLLGIDLGSSSVKAALVAVEGGECTASAQWPQREAPIKSLRAGWAEQSADDWWHYTCTAVRQAMKKAEARPEQVVAVGITYQMHGLVCLDADLRPLRDAIIWCDSRGVPYGEVAARQLGSDFCQQHLLGTPGNFTATKLAWVRENEPRLFDAIRCIMLPGDYLSLRMTGEAATTDCGLSEMMLWDYAEGRVATPVMDCLGIPHAVLPPRVPTFGVQARLRAQAADELGLQAGIPVAYRAGDQPNNALSLAVLQPGQAATTAGTSGVVYAITDQVQADPQSRVNTFLHVNHHAQAPRLGVMHCINGCGILNSWMHHQVSPALDYDEMNRLASDAPVGSEGLTVIPFGNGAERVLVNQNIGSSVHGLDFNRHAVAHLLRASQEGIAFALCYGMEVMQQLGMRHEVIHAGRANLFLSPLFRSTLASTSGAVIQLYDTDGAVGAARGAGMGAGLYASAHEAFASLALLHEDEPTPDWVNPCREAYERWKTCLHTVLASE